MSNIHRPIIFPGLQKAPDGKRISNRPWKNAFLRWTQSTIFIYIYYNIIIMMMIIYIVHIQCILYIHILVNCQVPQLHKRVGEPDYTYPKATQFWKFTEFLWWLFEQLNFYEVSSLIQLFFFCLSIMLISWQRKKLHFDGSLFCCFILDRWSLSVT